MASLPLMRIRVADTLRPPDDAQLPFLKGGPVDITLESALTLLVRRKRVRKDHAVRVCPGSFRCPA
jgi:hypothetical protein